MEIKPKSLIISLCSLLLLLHSTTAVCVKRSHTYGLQELFVKTLTPSSQPITPAPAQPVTPPPAQSLTPPPAQSLTAPPVQSLTPPPVQSVTPTPAQSVTSPAAEPVTPSPAKPVETQTFQPFIPPLVQTQGATLASSDDELLHIVPGSVGALSGIRDICAKTDHPQVCMAAVPRTIQPDPASVLMALIKSVQDKTHVAIEAAKKLSEKGTVPSIIAGNLDVCQENYAEALDNLLSASNAIAARDVGTMNIMLSAALTDFSTCENGFGEMPGISPLKVYDDILIELASNCLAVAELMK